MMPNIDQALYERFKREGYRLRRYQVLPVTSTSELVQLAYLDVNRTMRGISSQQSGSFKQSVISLIENLLKNPPKDQAEFDMLHHSCCKQCVSYSSPTAALIHYGQAQKLLNMSLKYLYNEYARFKEDLFKFPNNNFERFFHLPIDSQIRNYLLRNSQFTDPTSLPWSKWTYENYISFQNQLRKRMRPEYWPLEIDYLIWNTNGALLECFYPNVVSS